MGESEVGSGLGGGEVEGDQGEDYGWVGETVEVRVGVEDVGFGSGWGGGP